MHVDRITLGAHPTVCYLISSQKNNTLIIDPGNNPDKIIKFIESNALRPKIILITHGHYDHVEAVNALKIKYQTTVYLSKADMPLLNNLSMQSFHAGHQFELVTIDKYLIDNDIIKLDELDIKVLATPGHSPGSLSFLVENCLFSGDTLFSDGGIGRTDLYMGSFQDISHSIRTKLFTLPEDTIVYPGHGNSSTIGKEKAIHKSYSII